MARISQASTKANLGITLLPGSKFLLIKFSMFSGMALLKLARYYPVLDVVDLHQCLSIHG
jgi:hypothetical protein